MPTRKAKYPGRSRVLSRADARDWLFRAVTGEPIAPWCITPLEVHAIGLPGFAEAVVGDTQRAPFTMRVPCRKCEGCLKHRAKLWTARAIDEIQMANRTWFVTLTVAPEHRFRLGLIAEKRYLRASSESLNGVSDDDRFRYLWSELSREITKFIKRVRKDKPTVRFLCVAERHKDGFPHAHLLIHERCGPIAKSVIQAKWRLGYSQCKLVDDGPSASFYVSKYLAKEASARVRASLRYGQGLQDWITEQIVACCDAAMPS